MAPTIEDAHVAAVLDAARNGSTEALQSALQQHGDGAPVQNLRDSKGRTALHVAAQGNHAELCEHLIGHHGMPVNVQDEEGDTPLALAAFAGHKPVVDLLLDRGADANVHHQGCAGPLHRAALAGHAGVAQALLDKGADVHGGAGAGAPIAWAAGAGQGPVVDVLLKAGADPNGAGQNGVTPLLMAAAIGSVPTVRSLVNAGANVATQGPGKVTALHVAANSGSLEMVNSLLEAGADPSAVDEQGRTPAKIAAAGGHRPVVAALLKRAGGAGATAAAVGGGGGGGAGAGAVAGRGGGGNDDGVDSAAVEELVAQAQREAQEAAHAGAPEGGQAIVIPVPEDPNDDLAEALRKEGNALFAAGQYEAAEEKYTASLKHATRVAATWANRSACYLKLGRAQEALDDARRARALDPKYVKAWYREGAAAEKLGRWEDAAVGYYEAYMLQPENEEFALMMKRVITKGRKENQQQQQGEEGQGDVAGKQLQQQQQQGEEGKGDAAGKQ